MPGERLVYEVWSETNPNQKYRVDMESHWGNGKCDCKDFAVRKAPELKRFTKSDRPPLWNLWTYRCKHIRAAIPFIGLVFIGASIAELERKGELNDEIDDAT